ncbi:MAG TPA: hypothetical protein VNN10_15995 [Dehalococcoidia bacterium]|nr:hypothetical protein [Dehalococcoidia bacterium]
MLSERLARRFASIFVIGSVPVEVTRLDAVVWPDACLGVHPPGALCSAQTIPGYEARILVNNEMTYELRASLDLMTVVWPAKEQIEGIITSLEPHLIVIRGDGPLFERSLIPGFAQAYIAPGTQFLTPGGQVAVGQKVRMGTNAWPSSDVPVAVWVAPAD